MYRAFIVAIAVEPKVIVRQSRNNPDKDDVIFWTNGGPGYVHARSCDAIRTG